MAGTRSTSNDGEKFNGMGSKAVLAKTGKTWPQWFKILDAGGAKKLDHKGIVALLADQHAVGPWWQQMLTVGYEQARGLRAKHERPDGFQISASKTIAAPAAELFAAWTDEKRRRLWLPEAKLTIRTATRAKSIRITWNDSTNVEVMLYSKPGGKTQITLQQSKLSTAAAGERMKKFWRERLAALEGDVAST